MLVALIYSLRRQASFVLITISAVALLSGCVAPGKRVSYRTSVNAATEMAKIHNVAVLPMDVEVSQLNTGGMIEKHDDWTSQVVDNLNRAIAEQTHCKPASPSIALSPSDLSEVHALFRAITANQIIHSFYGPPQLTSVRGPLVYQIGPIDTLLDAAKSDAALLLSVHDDHATAGRRTVSIIGTIAGIPMRTGITVSSAALVSRDGTVLWMNFMGAKASSDDLRTQDGADEVVKNLFAGLPSLVLAH